MNLPDRFLRHTVWWLAGTLVYLQFLSLLKLLGNVALTSLPLAVGTVLIFVFTRSSSSLKSARTISFDLAAAIVLLTIITYARALQPPRGYEVLAYHLPYTVEWMRHGWAVPFYSAFSQPIGYYPGNLEILALPFLNLSHSAYLVNAINIFSYLLIMGVVWALARQINVRPSLAVLFFTLLTFTSPVTSQLLGNAYNDLFLAAALITAWYFAETFLRFRRIEDAWLSGLLIGIAIGTRYTGLVYALVFVIVFAIRARRIIPIVIFGVAILLPSIYWYLRTWAITGNPFYPQPMNLFGSRLFAGVYAAHPEQFLLVHLREPQFVWDLLRAIVQNGHLLLLPFAVLFPVHRFYRKELNGFWIAGLICFVLYMFMPLGAEDFNEVSINYRYALPFQWFVMIAGGLALLAAMPLERLSAWFDRHAIQVSRSVAVFAFVALLVIGYPVYQRGYVSRLSGLNRQLARACEFIETLPRSRIAYAGREVSGALYGRHLQHEVEYANVNRMNGSNFHEYAGTDPRASQDFDAWRGNLDAELIDILWVFKHPPTAEREWVLANERLFPLLYEDESVCIVRVQGVGSDESYLKASY